MPLVDASGAVKAAYEYLIKVSQDAAKYSNFKVEELQIDKDGNFLVTISYEFSGGEFPFERKREYKDFVVEKAAGNVLKMTIRKL